MAQCDFAQDFHSRCPLRQDAGLVCTSSRRTEGGRPPRTAFHPFLPKSVLTRRWRQWHRLLSSSENTVTQFFREYSHSLLLSSRVNCLLAKSSAWLPGADFNFLCLPATESLAISESLTSIPPYTNVGREVICQNGGTTAIVFQMYPTDQNNKEKEKQWWETIYKACFQWSVSDYFY